MDRDSKLRTLMASLDGKSVLVTGGTGSFGRAFVQMALKYSDVAKVIVFSRDEQKHYALGQQLRDPRLRCFVGDIRDRDRLKSAFRGVDIIVHAAAMKHVPICEYNPLEAIHTNITGAKNLIEMAIECGVGRVVALSTDKAVAPANLYGATKLCMERLLIAANAYSGDLPTRFSVVRYGNVMGSAGSVIPLFEKQRDRGCLTITDKRMTRFWISMNGAIQLVLQALSMMQGGEVFVPKLPTTDIETLAEAIAPGVRREEIGIRPGEKLHETLISPEEATRTVDLGEVLMIQPEFGDAKPSVGDPVNDDFYYASDREDLRLSLDATRELLAAMP